MIAFGEPLVQFSPLESGPLSYASLFDKHVAGSESNVLIGISRLGHRTALITKLGTDELSRFILSTLKGEGVDTRWISQLPDKSCGIYISQRNFPVPGKNDVVYFRSDSATRTFAASDLPREAFAHGRIFHLSGITPALSDACLKASFRAVRLAKENQMTFSFDPNYRRKLWPAKKAARAYKRLVASADIIFLDVTEASIILEKEQRGAKPELTARALAKLGPKVVVLKLGARGGIAALCDGAYTHSPSFEVAVVDVIGAGDAVVAGFLSGLLDGKDPLTCLRWAAAASSLVVSRRGDFENLPTPTQLESFLAARSDAGNFDLR